VVNSRDFWRTSKLAGTPEQSKMLGAARRGGRLAGIATASGWLSAPCAIAPASSSLALPPHARVRDCPVIFAPCCVELSVACVAAPRMHTGAPRAIPTPGRVPHDRSFLPASMFPLSSAFLHPCGRPRPGGEFARRNLVQDMSSMQAKILNSTLHSDCA